MSSVAIVLSALALLLAGVMMVMVARDRRMVRRHMQDQSIYERMSHMRAVLYYVVDGQRRHIVDTDIATLYFSTKYSGGMWYQQYVLPENQTLTLEFQLPEMIAARRKVGS